MKLCTQYERGRARGGGVGAWGGGGEGGGGDRDCKLHVIKHKKRIITNDHLIFQHGHGQETVMVKNVCLFHTLQSQGA